MKDHVGIQFKTHKWKRLVENVLRPLYTSIGSQEAAENFSNPIKIEVFVRQSLIISYMPGICTCAYQFISVMFNISLKLEI